MCNSSKRFCIAQVNIYSLHWKCCKICWNVFHTLRDGFRFHRWYLFFLAFCRTFWFHREESLPHCTLCAVLFALYKFSTLKNGRPLGSLRRYLTWIMNVNLIQLILWQYCHQLRSGAPRFLKPRYSRLCAIIPLPKYSMWKKYSKFWKFAESYADNKSITNNFPNDWITHFCTSYFNILS